MIVEKLNIEEILSEVCDPEIPVLTIRDIGILREVELIDDIWHITITPTYSGCPGDEYYRDKFTPGSEVS